jgi:hypothetical protein
VRTLSHESNPASALARPGLASRFLVYSACRSETPGLDFLP